MPNPSRPNPSPLGGDAIVHYLYISPGHNRFNRPGGESPEHETLAVEEVECVAGKGLVGDRFFDYKPDYKGQVTFFSLDVFMAMCAVLDVWDREPGVLRRNAVVSGVDLNQLIGQRFVLQGIEFEGTEEAKPCPWMDEEFAAGAKEWMNGRGGLRARILSDGRLRVNGDGSLP